MPEIKSSNPKAFQTLANNLKALSSSQSKVGWFSSSKYESGMPVAAVAAIQELGSVKQSIPPRPFMRPTSVAKQKEWADIAAAGAKEVLAGNADPSLVMEMLGFKAEGDILKAIVDIVSPPLSPITLELRAMKQKDPSLKVTGTLVGEVAAKVKEPGYEKPNVSDKPLNFTGYLISQLTHITEDTA